MIWPMAFILALFACVAGTVRAAQDDARRLQLAAASDDAIATLRADILSARLGGAFTVGRIFDAAGALDRLDKLLATAEQRGGTRWRDDLTCEVRMELRGAEVAGLLSAIAAEQPAKIEMEQAMFRGGLDDLAGQTFSALGRSTASYDLARIRPPESAAVWNNVRQEDVTAALESAKRNAIGRMFESVAAVEVGRGRRIGDAFGTADSAATVRQWLESRPFTRIEFRDDLEVRVTLAAPADELWPVMHGVLVQEKLGPPASDDAGWRPIRAAFLAAAVPATGRSTPPTTREGPAAAPPIAQMPAREPAWVGRQLDADGVAAGAGLKTARLAESQALNGLREKIAQLPLDGSTLGEVASRDPRVADAIARVIHRAPATKVDYQEQGRVKVRVSLELWLLWRELATMP